MKPSWETKQIVSIRGESIINNTRIFLVFVFSAFFWHSIRSLSLAFNFLTNDMDWRR